MIDFKAPYARENILSFLGRFLPDDFQKTIEENISLNFKPQFIESVNKLGEVKSLQELHIFEITHGSENDPRIGLSRDVFRLLANFGVKKALVFSISQKSTNYRFSLITLDLKWESGKKVEREYSNPKRCSFFLGPEAKTHTPSDFLANRGVVKDVKDLVSRFDVEIVTKEFFTEYKKLFDNLHKYLSKDRAFSIIAENNNANIDVFAKKILGQIVFCYFLQKKGWLGAPKKALMNEGDKDFMRTLFNRCSEKNENFYNNYLEYLFYDSLNMASDEGDFYRKHLGCQIPFLNGGLFEPLDKYDWKKSLLRIPNEIFSNEQKTGIMDMFDLYNFTVHEDDPIDREVSVDPEMLGKVFENLLPENIRKGQGAFYTPREIVQYMCQESLISHLITETGIDEKNIRKLIISRVQLFTDADGLVFKSTEAEKIDNALSNIKICDPACGSGAFLVSMLHEIVTARRILNPKSHEYRLKKEAIQNSIYGVDIDPGAVDIAKLRLWLSLVVDYEIKDIEPLPNLDYKIMCGNSLLEELVIGDDAIKLFDEKLLYANKRQTRSSLFNEDEIDGMKSSARNDAIQKNLEEKQKEMLNLNNLGKLTPIIKKKLDQEIAAMLKDIAPKKTKKAKDYSPGLFAEEAEIYFVQLRELHKRYFSESDAGIKRCIRQQIEEIEFEFIKSSIEERINDIEVMLNNLNPSMPEDRKRSAELVKQKLEYSVIPNTIMKAMTKPYFLWRLNYFEVFQENNGFDVVIANPPYIAFQEIGKEFKNYFKTKFSCASGKYDIYVLFIEAAFRLSRNDASICFIVPNKFMLSGYGTQVKNVLMQNKIIEIMDFKDIQLFDNATNYPCVLQLRKTPADSSSIIMHKDVVRLDQGRIDYELSLVEQKDLTGAQWRFSRDDGSHLFDKIKLSPHTLDDYASEITQGIRTGSLGVYFNNITKQSIENHKIEKELIKLVCTGKNVKRYHSNLNTENDLILFPYNTDHKTPVDLRRYPGAFAYLNTFRTELAARKDSGRVFRDTSKAWYEYWDPKPITFEKPKIVFPDISSHNQFYLDLKGIPYLNTCYGIYLKKDVDPYFILGFLNSKVAEYFIKQITPSVRGGFHRYKTGYLKTIPIPAVSQIEISKINHYVNAIVRLYEKSDGRSKTSSKSEIELFEMKIDEIVFSLFGLNESEIKIIEKTVKRMK